MFHFCCWPVLHIANVIIMYHLYNTSSVQRTGLWSGSPELWLGLQARLGNPLGRFSGLRKAHWFLHKLAMPLLGCHFFEEKSGNKIDPGFIYSIAK